MKNLKTIAIALLVAFGTANVSAQTQKIDANKSKLTWVGKKVTGQHDGTVAMQSGNLIFKDAKLIGGTFTVNMQSISVADLKVGEGKEKLEGHLKGDDFFGVEKHPTAVLVFKTVTSKSADVYAVNGDLTIKGVTKPVTLDIIVKGNIATSTFKVDRTKYDIKYGSGSFFDNLGDKAISDDFEVSAMIAY